MVKYYGYFARLRAARIEEIDSRETRIAQLRRTSSARRRISSPCRRKRAARSRASCGPARSAPGAIHALSEQVQSGNEQLARLKQEEQAVESLVADLERVLKDFPVDSAQSFEQLRGRLPWPVSGKMTVRYQETRDHGAPSAVRLNGVMIETARGAKVRAPCAGRVVYADWLQGMGLLMIIAHSGNFLTLYGHAEVLYKSVGDRGGAGRCDRRRERCRRDAAAAVLRDPRGTQARRSKGLAQVEPVKQTSAASESTKLAAKRGRTYAAADEHEMAQCDARSGGYRDRPVALARARSTCRQACGARAERALAGCPAARRGDESGRARVRRARGRSSPAAGGRARHGVLARSLFGLSRRRRIRRHQDLELGRVFRRRHRGLDGGRAGRRGGAARRLVGGRGGHSSRRRDCHHRQRAREHHHARRHHRTDARQGRHDGQSRHSCARAARSPCSSP